MQSFLDAMTAIVGRDAAPWLGVFLLSSPIWLYAAMRLRQSLQRRRELRDFAATHRLQFVGTIASDARAPYTRFTLVSRQVTLSNVIEGQWDGLPIRLFEGAGGREPRWTMVLVTVEGRLRRGTAAEGAIAGNAGGSQALIESDVDVLLVSPQRTLEAPELTVWLSFATAVAKAMERDAKEDVAFYASE